MGGTPARQLQSTQRLLQGRKVKLLLLPARLTLLLLLLLGPALAVQEGLLIQISPQELGQDVWLCVLVDILYFVTDDDHLVDGVTSEGGGDLAPNCVEQHGGVHEHQATWGN